ncbi:hypothetical protein BYT27DRAFT_7194672 [Phlegmacium glaucopus]|nr:hypothetical protein BYT27DRAFT_7194672 [Phlegmacium glaucopus]
MAIPRLGCQLRAMLQIFLLLLRLTDSFGSIDSIDSFLLALPNYQILSSFFSGGYMRKDVPVNIYLLFSFYQIGNARRFPKSIRSSSSSQRDFAARRKGDACSSSGDS